MFIRFAAIFISIFIGLCLIYVMCLAIGEDSPYNHPLNVFFDPIIHYYKPVNDSIYQYTIYSGESIIYRNHNDLSNPSTELYNLECNNDKRTIVMGIGK